MKCLFSQHIPKSNIDAATIIEDIETFNCAVHKAFVLNKKDKDSLKSKKEQGKPDLRLKENKEKKDSLPPSTHMQIKEEYSFNDYFANSACQQAKAVLKSVLELRQSDKKEKEAVLKEVEAKLKSAKNRLEQLNKTKRCLVEYSKWKKDKNGKKPRIRMPKGSVEVLDRNAETVSVFHYNNKTKKRRLLKTYANLYLFEIQYLDPFIKRLKYKVRSLELRVKKLERQIDDLKREPSVCFGSKALFHKQHTVYKEDHKTWKSVFHKARNKGMTISGRKDSKYGNYVFSYDPDTYELTYRSIKGKKVIIPNVRFPYGQFLLDQYIRKQRAERIAPIAWRIEITGNSFLIKCMLHLPETDTNYCYLDGCVGVDMNLDCLALSETDSKGNLLHHEIIPFGLTGKSSEQSEHILSDALEKVFSYCFDQKKPLVMEELKDVATTSVYGSPKRNRAVTSFAHTKMTELALSKSWKYGIEVTFVNPAYTSQIGKMKYMSRYGLSIHEASSFVIARRGMRLKEKLPFFLKPYVPETRITRHHWSHWNYLYPKLKELSPSLCYCRFNKNTRKTS